ncbi:MAG: lysylphosphatidylglycerol synthase transmembrane domain-containing protein [Planctomycetales bacterium]
MVTAVCLAAAFWGFGADDWRQMGSSFRQANYATLPLFLFLLFLFFWLKAVRWRLLLRPIRAFRTREVAPAMMIGFMGNNVLPAHLGEFVRMYVFARDHKLSRSAVLTSLVLERMFDVLSILLFLGVSLVLLPNPPEAFRRYVPGTLGVVAVLLAVLAVYIFWTRPFVRFAEWCLDRVPLLPRGLKLRLAGMLEEGAAGLASMRRPKLAAGVVATSIAQWFLVGGFVHLSLRSFGIEESPLAAFVVVAGTAVAVTIPSSPGFFGVVQGAFLISLAPFGIARAEAVAASIYFQIVQYVPVTLVGLYYLNRSGLKLGQIGAQAELEEERVERELAETAQAEMNVKRDD